MEAVWQKRGIQTHQTFHGHPAEQEDPSWIQSEGDGHASCDCGFRVGGSRDLGLEVAVRFVEVLQVALHFHHLIRSERLGVEIAGNGEQLRTREGRLSIESHGSPHVLGALDDLHREIDVGGDWRRAELRHENRGFEEALRGIQAAQLFQARLDIRFHIRKIVLLIGESFLGGTEKVIAERVIRHLPVTAESDLAQGRDRPLAHLQHQVMGIGYLPHHFRLGIAMGAIILGQKKSGIVGTSIGQALVLDLLDLLGNGGFQVFEIESRRARKIHLHGARHLRRRSGRALCFGHGLRGPVGRPHRLLGQDRQSGRGTADENEERCALVHHLKRMTYLI